MVKMKTSENNLYFNKWTWRSHGMKTPKEDINKLEYIVTIPSAMPSSSQQVGVSAV
jgi:hypothetical protein